MTRRPQVTYSGQQSSVVLPVAFSVATIAMISLHYLYKTNPTCFQLHVLRNMFLSKNRFRFVNIPSENILNFNCTQYNFIKRNGLRGRGFTLE